MKTAEQLIEIAIKNDLLRALFENDFDDLEIEDEEGEYIEITEDYLKNLDLGELEYLDGRNDTSEFWQVIYFKDHDVYLRIDGEYDSYGQGDDTYDTIRQVFPKQVTQTIYE